MKRPLTLWIIAVLLAVGTAVYQRLTGPTYPIRGSVTLAGEEIPYRLDRSHGGEDDHPVRLTVPNPAVSGFMEWRRHKTPDSWTRVEMRREGESLTAELPRQPLAGHLDYKITLSQGTESVLVPQEGGVVIRFKGDVPLWILIIHVVVIFGAMILGMRAALEYFSVHPRFTTFAWWTVGFLAVGGMILGPVVQKYAFDAYWTGWPFGTDLTDNKTLVALIAWVVAAIAVRRSQNPQRWVLGAGIVMIVVFLIPHSLLGSEFDYSKVDPRTSSPPIESPVPGAR